MAGGGRPGRGRWFWAGLGYVGTVALLGSLAAVAGESVQDALYLTAIGLALPFGVLIPPVLYMALVVVEMAAEGVGLGPAAGEVIAITVTVVVFGGVAVLNVLLGRPGWALIRRRRPAPGP